MRTTFVKTLNTLAENDRKVVLLIGDLGFSVFEDFQKAYPEQFYNVGIAESSMIGIAAGLAMSGKKVFVYSIIPFVTMRCFEQIRTDLCDQNLNVTIVGVGSGFVYGAQGATHHAIEDIAVMRALPNMTIFSPGDSYEAEQVTKAAYAVKGPSYIRLGKNGEPSLMTLDDEGTLGSFVRKIADGFDINLLTTGSISLTALEVSKRLKEYGFSAAVYSVSKIKPLNAAFLDMLLQQGQPIFTIEEHSIIGGLGSSVSEYIAESSGPKIRFKRFGVLDKFETIAGNQEFSKKNNKLSSDQIVSEILKILG